MAHSSHHHDHEHSYQRRSPTAQREALAAAGNLAHAQGKSFTKQRAAVFQLLLSADRPLGAYELMARLGEVQGKQVAPPTVYRALEFLLELGVIARIESRNEYLPCAHPEEDHDCMFLVCTCCGTATEISGAKVLEAIEAAVAHSDFTPERRVVEIRGRCAQCR